MIVTVGATKGGVGKTTLALNLAALALFERRRVWLIDADAQGTAAAATAARRALQVDCWDMDHLADAGRLLAQIKDRSASYDLVVIDAGGRDSAALRAALTVSDLVVIPLQPRSFDLWALEDMAQLVKQVQSSRPLRALAVVNQADPRGPEAAQVLGLIEADMPGIQVHRVPVVRRKAIAEAAENGLGAHETKKWDERAADELAALYDAIKEQ